MNIKFNFYFILLFSCAVEVPQNVSKTQKNPFENNALQSSSDSLSSTPLYANDHSTAPILKKGENARVTLSSGPSLVSPGEGAGIKVPSLSLALGGTDIADYVEILRCSHEVSLKYLGTSYKDISKTSVLRKEHLRSIWNQARASLEYCHVASSLFTGNIFYDFSASSGEFLYLINPCVFASKSFASEHCSFEFVVSDVIRYENTMKKAVYDKMKELADLEGRFQGLNSQLVNLARDLQKKQDSCEEEYAVRESVKSFWKGVATFAAAGVGAAVGGVFSGGTASLMGAKTGLQIASGIVGKIQSPPFSCPPIEPLRQEFIQNYEAVPVVLEKALQVRKDIQTLESSYSDIDATLFDSLKPD